MNPTALKREQRIAEAKKRREAIHAELLVLRHTLETDYLTKQLPDNVRALVWAHAYDEGHAFGVSQVELHYGEYAELALTAYVDGRESILRELRNKPE